jgi:hypothetical protein
MSSSNGDDPKLASVKVAENPVAETTAAMAQELPTRGRQKVNDSFARDRVVMAAAGALVLALVLFVSWSLPRKPLKARGTDTATGGASSQSAAQDGARRSVSPIMNSSQSTAAGKHDGTVNARDIEGTANESPSSTPGTLGGIPPFGGQQDWQAPPFQSQASANDADDPESGKTERDTLSKSSIVFVRTVSVDAAGAGSRTTETVADPGVRFPTGTRLQARLAFEANTAVKARVIAVVDYNYERDGEILIPAGARAVGNIEQADRSGYLSIRFDSLEMPDGSRVPIEAVATDLRSQMIKGRVEGKNTGKSVLARSLSGIGQAGAMLIGRGSLNQPLSEGDLVRERVGDNIGLASDQQVNRLALTEHVVVSIAAGTPIYIVMQEGGRQLRGGADASPRTAQRGSSPSAQELRELLQLQRELNQTGASANQNN